jgi:hypothetical protein
MNDEREKLEQLIGAVLREQPLRRAPPAMESRVLAAIESHAAMSGWRRGFMHWPVFARVAFILASFAIVRFTLLATDWTLTAVNPEGFFAGALSKISWIKVVAEVVYSSLRSIPEHWLWAGLVIVAAIYGALFVISAIAYRTLYANR